MKQGLEAFSISSPACVRWSRLALLLAPLLLASAIAAQDIGFEGPSFAGAGATPTESKPESKLWYHDGSWWGSLWSTADDSFNIHRLNFTTHAWVDTHVEIDTRPNSHSDVKWDGTKLYVASHQFVANGGSSGNPIRVFRYSYNASTDTYSRDAGFPVTIGDFSTEALVIDKDSTGVVWAAWTQSQRVRIAHTLSSDTSWSSSVVLPTNTTNLNVDDICSLIAFNGRIGVLWSDQVVNAYRFSTHVDGTSDATWTAVENVTTRETDDHLNLAADGTGRVFLAAKNAGNEVLLLVRSTGGTWSRFVVSTPKPIRTRPIVLLDEVSRIVHIFATGQDTGEVFTKTSSLDSISFPAGDGTIVMRDASTVFRISDPTSTKQNVTPASGLVVLAHHDTTGFYWHHEVAGVGVGGPVASFTASPTSGDAPLNVRFTDTSTGSITSRLWNFGDGQTSTSTNPRHTYRANGTFTVGLTVTGPSGSDTETKTALIRVGSGGSNTPPAVRAALQAYASLGSDEIVSRVIATAEDAQDGALVPTVRLIALDRKGKETSVALAPGDRIQLRVNQGSVKFEDASGLRLRARAYAFRLEVEAQDSGGLRTLDSVYVDKSVTEFLHRLEPSISIQPYDVE